MNFRELNKRKLSGSFLVAFIIILTGIMLAVEPASAQKRKARNTIPPQPAEQGILLTEKGLSLYRIVIPSSPTPEEREAASVLQYHLLHISNAALPILTADMPGSSFEVVLGQNERLDEAGISINFNELGADGFIIRTDSSRLIIAGGNKKGTLYGVYTFLEKYLGCRMYSPDVKIIPKKDKIILSEINDKQIPVIRFRDTHYRITWDREYSDWHKLSHDERGNRTAWGSWVHTFNSLVPPEIYFKDHPEYYALRNGKRIPTQLCLTNPDVLKVTIQNLRKAMAGKPNAYYWSVSQNDNRNYCLCENCSAVDEREGSPSGSILNFVNQVADAFPDHMISTLAYEYSRKAPLTIRPRNNVNIMLCSIEMRRDRPFALAEDTVSMEFVRDVKEWSKIAGDIIVWDYVIQFPNLISPFPNLHVLQPNIRFFAENGVKAMFEQGNREVGGEFAELRAYLISKLLWDPDENVDTLMNDFLSGYYGPAGKFIRQYIDIMREALISSDRPLRIFGSPNEAAVSYLTPLLIRQYMQLFDMAESVAADSAELLERVKIARLPLNFAVMEQAKRNFTGENGVFVRSGDQWIVRPEIRSMIDPFVDLCIRQGVTRVKEWSTTPEAYRASMYRLFYQGRNEHLAFGKEVKFISPDTSRIRKEERGMLTDGIRGSHDPEYNWLDFQGSNLYAIIDLGDVQKIQHIECAFYQLAAWLSIVPEKVEFFISTDGKEFENVGTVINTLPINQYDSFQRDFIVDFEPVDARFVKVVAHTIGNTPEDHPGAGQPARMHIDEIVVE
ncbi:MAG: DUF4838 domain-containing protein [Bacteroidales bacterium]|nr:DUF4838 domain-containing protein [Bacteroidales bacterium]